MSEKVGYLGPDFVTFGYMAAEKYFQEKDVEMVPYQNHYEICEAVGRGQIEYGVVAIENVIDGVVVETIHAVEHIYRKYHAHIFSEIEIPIALFYLQKKEAESEPKILLSHITALRQSQRFVASLQEQGIKVEVRSSTGQAAKEVSENPELAVLASVRAEEVYDLKRLVQESVADDPNNFTKFWVLSFRHSPRTGHDKTCILINLEQQVPGGVWKSLEPFAKEKVNLLNIYPNPIPGRKWEYTFVLEFAGHILDKNVDAAYDKLNSSGVCLGGPLLFGSFPAILEEEGDNENK